MSKFNNILIYLLSILGIAFMLASCESEEKVNLQEATEHPLVGEWKVDAYIGNEVIFKNVILNADQISSTRNDSIVLRDTVNYFWDFQVKVAVINKNSLFQTQHSVSEVADHNIGVKISNGKIINNDSIYFEVAFEDDEIPYGTIYQMKGSRLN